MKSIIIGNWKMNPVSLKEAKELFDGVKKGVKNTEAEVVVCPPFIYLAEFNGLPLGAQNVFYKEKGAFTGEVSPLMLKDLGVEYVLIGHSERRKYFAETNEDINKKVKVALEAGLKVVLCVGEQEGEDKLPIITTQVNEGLAGVSNVKGQMSNVAIAYEPVWAIGTGKNCSVDETMKSILLIRKMATDLYSRETADSVRILYGGSVKAENAVGYIKEAGANGLLVGGASLDAKEFTKIIKSVE